MIEFPLHALEQMEDRGVTREEAIRVIERGAACEARSPRLGREMVFTGAYEWKGKHYPHKKVRAIFVRENDNVVIVTIYSYYGKWEESE